MTFIANVRMAWRLARLITRCQRLIREQRQLPKDDRQPFIVFCNVYGNMDVEFFDDTQTYVEACEELADVDGWAACYDPWKDKK